MQTNTEAFYTCLANYLECFTPLYSAVVSLALAVTPSK